MVSSKLLHIIAWSLCVLRVEALWNIQIFGPYRRGSVGNYRNQSPPTTSTSTVPYSFLVPSVKVIQPTTTSQGMVVTSLIPIYEVCALPGNNTTSCSVALQTITTSSCSTVLTAFYQNVTVSDCSQNITFSSQSSCILASTSSPSSTPTTYIESVVSYYVAPWQSLAAQNSSTITVNICKTDFVGNVICNQIQEVWVVHAKHVPVISTATLSISTSFSSGVVLLFGPTESLTASPGIFSLSTEIKHTSSSATELTSTSTDVISSSSDENTSTSTSTSTITVTIGKTITKTLQYASTSEL